MPSRTATGQRRRGVPAAQGETATPASGPRPARVRFFKIYRAPRVRSASAAVFPRGNRTLARAWRGRGAGCRHFFGLGGAGVARAWPVTPGITGQWRGRGAG
eukprot:gene23220-biopygen4295